MKLYIESAKCCGFGECIALAPDIFAMGDDNRAVFVGDAVVDGATVHEADEERVRTAAFSCPAEAIGVVE